MRALLRPAVARGHEAQFGQTEIRHGARHHADIFGQLRLDEDDDRVGHRRTSEKWCPGQRQRPPLSAKSAWRPVPCECVQKYRIRKRPPEIFVPEGLP
jgi:hypothetical protein